MYIYIYTRRLAPRVRASESAVVVCACLVYVCNYIPVYGYTHTHTHTGARKCFINDIRTLNNFRCFYYISRYFILFKM